MKIAKFETAYEYTTKIQENQAVDSQVPQGANSQNLLSKDEKDQLLKHMNPLNEIFKIIPFWYTNLNEQNY